VEHPRPGVRMGAVAAVAMGRPTGLRTTPDCFAPQERVQNERINPFCDWRDPLRIATDASLPDS
jgi:hypothetical protein